MVNFSEEFFSNLFQHKQRKLKKILSIPDWLNSPHLIRKAIELGLDINARHGSTDFTLLMSVIRRMDEPIELLTYLFEKGADPNIQDSKGRTALSILITRYNTSYNVIEFLINNGADVNIRDKNGQTALMLALKHNGSIPIIAILLDNGAVLDLHDNNGRTALMYAVESGNTEAVKLLTEKGSAVNEKDNNGLTPLMILSSCNHFFTWDNPDSPIEIAGMLIRSGAEVNDKDQKGKTILMHLILGLQKYMEIRGDEDIIYENLHIFGKTREVSPNLGDTFYKYIDYLVKNRVDINSRDDNGLTVLKYVYDIKTVSEKDLGDKKKLIYRLENSGAKL